MIDAPYAGHRSTIADYAAGQSLVETLQAGSLEYVLVTDWKSATESMKNFDIDKYLKDIDTVVDHLGGTVDLVGLSQGGWMSTIYAARLPEKVRSPVLAGAPIDTDAGNGPIKQLAHTLPLGVYEDMVVAGGGRMRGKTMLAGWKSMNTEEQYLGKYLDLYQHIGDRNYIKRTEQFERWYENPIDLPGAYYLQAIQQIFKENRLAKGQFVGLEKRLSLKDIVCPVYLLAGSEDDITTRNKCSMLKNISVQRKSKSSRSWLQAGTSDCLWGRRRWPTAGPLLHTGSCLSATLLPNSKAVWRLPKVRWSPADFEKRVSWLASEHQGENGMEKMEQIELDRHRSEIIADMKMLVEKYRKIFDWDVPEINQILADQLILKSMREALGDIEKDLLG